MALSWNEIKNRALKFSNEWADETKENARIEYLFDLYNEYTSPMFNEKKKK
ncbi:MAG: hypothetical protein KAG64_05845 [Bacteroidales bacterium]|nr:hypothetical protein [Bacteroidales bacterium]